MNDLPTAEQRAAMDAECDSFAKAAAPLIQWLAENRHPHTKAIVTATGAELRRPTPWHTPTTMRRGWSRHSVVDG